MSQPTDAEGGAEDAKLRTLARAARGRTGAVEGAAVRDLDGRTYAAATVDLAHLRLSALALAVATAVSGGARGLEAAAVCTDGDQVDADDVSIVRDLAGSGVPVWLTDPTGAPRASVAT